jgi:hypothetical protein
MPTDLNETCPDEACSRLQNIQAIGSEVCGNDLARFLRRRQFNIEATSCEIDGVKDLSCKQSGIKAVIAEIPRQKEVNAWQTQPARSSTTRIQQTRQAERVALTRQDRQYRLAK